MHITDTQPVYRRNFKIENKLSVENKALVSYWMRKHTFNKYRTYREVLAATTIPTTKLFTGRHKIQIIQASAFGCYTVVDTDLG